MFDCLFKYAQKICSMTHTIPLYLFYNWLPLLLFHICRFIPLNRYPIAVVLDKAMILWYLIVLGTIYKMINSIIFYNANKFPDQPNITKRSFTKKIPTYVYTAGLLTIIEEKIWSQKIMTSFKCFQITQNG